MDPFKTRKFTVVRDPVSRFLSAYTNRVTYYRDMERECAQNPEIRSQFDELGLPAVPDLDVFIDNFEHYVNLSPSIRLHTRR